MCTALSLEKALSLMSGGLSPLEPEQLPVMRALGRTLAADVAAPMDQPPFEPSAPPTSPGRTGNIPSVCLWWIRSMRGTPPGVPWAPDRPSAS